MNDDQLVLRRLRSPEIRTGHSPVLMRSELEMHDRLVRYRSLYKASADSQSPQCTRMSRTASIRGNARDPIERRRR